MMYFARNLNNPLLQIVLCMGEAVIRAGCDQANPLFIQAEMSQFPDGRDCVHIRLQSLSEVAEFQILLANYLLAPRLYRVVRHGWFNRSRDRWVAPVRAPAAADAPLLAAAALN